ncbi:MAG: SRPBCC family protein [Bacteroidia bacterium]
MNNVLKYIGILLLFVAAGFYGMILLSPSEINFRVNEDVQAPIAEVYDAIANPSRWKKWMMNIQKIEQVKGDGLLQGSVTEVHYPQEMVLTRTLTLAEPNQQVVLDGIVKDFYQKVESYKLEALDSNTTRISCNVKMVALKTRSKMVLQVEETHVKNMAEALTSLKTYLVQ